LLKKNLKHVLDLALSRRRGVPHGIVTSNWTFFCRGGGFHQDIKLGVGSKATYLHQWEGLQENDCR